MIELCFLGTGGSVASEERDNTSFLINHDETLFLIDCPGSAIQKVKKLNFNPLKIGAILVTHIHPDHIYGLPSFVHSLMLDEGLINLYGSAESVDFCRNLLDLFHLRDKKIKTRINFIPLDPGQDLQLTESVRCTCLEVPHSSSSLAYHFRFEREKKELIYSGDTPPNPLLFKQAEGKDYLIHDCSAPSRFFKMYPSLHEMHTHSLELGSHAQSSSIKCLIPCHFFGELEFPLSEIGNEIRENYKGKLIIPKDYEKIVL
ncbi:MAG: ribonuclease Z [Candidatus Aminicenantaceae bacterium]